MLTKYNIWTKKKNRKCKHRRNDKNINVCEILSNNCIEKYVMVITSETNDVI